MRGEPSNKKHRLEAQLKYPEAPEREDAEIPLTAVREGCIPSISLLRGPLLHRQGELGYQCGPPARNYRTRTREDQNRLCLFSPCCFGDNLLKTSLFCLFVLLKQ